jgi:UPF0755 protein
MSIDQKNRAITFPRIGKFIIIFFAIAFLLVGARGYQLYRYIFQPNVQKNFVLLINDNDDFKTISKNLENNQVFTDFKAFNWVVKKKKYKDFVRPGRYLLKKGMNTNEAVNMLRSGAQQPVDITFNNVRFKEELAGKVSKYIQADSLSILHLFDNEKQIKAWGFTPENFRAMFIPNTYEMYWTTSAEEFAKRMKKEYDRFWNYERTAKAETIGLTPQQITTLASIVQSETIKTDEMPIVAGLYLNRIHKNIPLQADPTVKYAIGDFSIRRVLNEHLEIDSPYNTYKNTGLPPGPICFPSIKAIDAVLNYDNNQYLYMCAKEDFSGYHNFAKTQSQHNRNAAKYHNALNKNKIYK